ncbi:MAG: hypothetical protein JO141_04335 [Bradyrhizobium sp.]|nr:hypothetical protein [Bradyrhizobium sp.]
MKVTVRDNGEPTAETVPANRQITHPGPDAAHFRPDLRCSLPAAAMPHAIMTAVGALGMTDTGLSIWPDKANRCAKPLPTDPIPVSRRARSPELTEKLKFECGGGCAASTASDYLRFASMLMNGGHLSEARLLGPQDRPLHAV